ncbi:MAG TPA: DNA methyltransferase, partial [Lamprocystis sp. (in: g-proteobacteria)]|nr:DNA methyltransferase [Lamprocystis sp. (in: g-proteobacteria)]
PERLRPGQTTAALTEAATGRFGTLAQALRARGHAPWAVGHSCIRLLFCIFVEDIELLPRQLFTRLLDAGLKDPASLPAMLEDLFGAIATGGRIGFEPIEWFNGGLFDTRDALPLAVDDIKTLRVLAGLDWSAIEPSIFGTLFERGLDPDKRSQLGAHYTDRGSIMRLVDPVVLDPLRDEWTARKAEIQSMMEQGTTAKYPAARAKARNAAHAVLQGFLGRLAQFRVLDPACGSGNFLLLSLLGLKDLEHQVILEAEVLGLPRAFPMVGPENVLGIEINPYAAELAQVTVWIGEIQWMLAHGFSLSKHPILKTLNTIEQRDAVVNADGTEPAWPAADVIVGNPPFLGGSKKRGALGDAYFDALGRIYAGRVPAGADLVTYWFEKARAQIVAGNARAAGLVATNSIRGGANRTVLERIQRTDTRTNHGAPHDDDHLRYAATGGQAQGRGFFARTGGGRGPGNQRGPVGAGDEGRSGASARPVADRPDRAEMDDGGAAGGGDVAHPEGLLLDKPLSIFNAWSDEPWINEGAAVRVSMICFGARGQGRPVQLNGVVTDAVNADLTPSLDGDGTSDLTRAKALHENRQIGFQGTKKGAAFDIPSDCPLTIPLRFWLTARPYAVPKVASNRGLITPT